MLRRAITVLVVALTFGVRAAPSAPTRDDPDASELRAPLVTVAQAGEPERAPRPGLGLAMIVTMVRLAVARVAVIEDTPVAPVIVARGGSLADRARAPPRPA